DRPGAEVPDATDRRQDLYRPEAVHRQVGKPSLSQSHIYISFESVNFPGRFIRHRENHLFVEPKDSPNLAPDATFLPVLHMA
ncbi:AbfB domain-containing protein, partial [Streptomyces sviceus]|uniref:AbfB domain-containing protein n=1 Tax=Streptomyces sviceus TaxID=285530 RepID=UPI0033184E69